MKSEKYNTNSSTSDRYKENLRHSASDQNHYHSTTNEDVSFR